MRADRLVCRIRSPERHHSVQQVPTGTTRLARDLGRTPPQLCRTPAQQPRLPCQYRLRLDAERGRNPVQAGQGAPGALHYPSIEHDDIQEAAGRRDAHRLYNVRSISLVDLLDQFDAPAQIDLLSIDTEGSELDILRAFDFRRARFATIVVEHGYSSQRDPIHALLSAQGYHRIWRELSDHDDW